MTPERLADIKNGTLQPDKDIADLLTENAELRSELARVKEAATVLARWCAESLDDMMPGYVCENHTASALVRAAKDQA